jgi:hypothetical protein
VSVQGLIDPFHCVLEPPYILYVLHKLYDETDRDCYQRSQVNVLKKLWNVLLSQELVLNCIDTLELLFSLQREPVMDGIKLELLDQTEDRGLVVVLRLLQLTVVAEYLILDSDP